MLPLDTTAETHAIQMRLLRERSNEDRLKMALQLSEDIRAIQRAGIRAHHPEYSEVDAEWALRRHLHGDELFQCAWPDAPLLSP
jgi:hypothetical protein